MRKNGKSYLANLVGRRKLNNNQVKEFYFLNKKFYCYVTLLGVR